MNIERIMKKYGRKITAADCCGNTVDEKYCFVQALRYKNKMYTEGTPTEIGVNDSGYYLFLGPADMRIDEIGDRGYLTDGDKKFHIDRSEKIYFRNKVFYIWAVLKEHTTGKYPYYNHFAERR